MALIRDDSALEPLVERGQRLVHQQQLWRGEQGAAERHALAFAARKIPGSACEQCADFEEIDDLRRCETARYCGQQIVTVAQVFFDA